MSCEAGNENCTQEQREFGHAEIENQCNSSGEDLNDSLQQNVDSGIDKPLTSGIDTGGIANPGADENVHDEPVLVVTPEWQRRSWLLEVSQSAEDNPESVMSVNSDNESDGGSWTLEDGPDAHLKSYELQMRNMTSINEALKARARKAEKELSDNEKAFKQQLFDANMNHAESLQAHQDQWDIERAAALKSRQELLRDQNHLAARYRTACMEIKDQTRKINDLDAQLSESAEVLNQAKAPDGSICTHKQIQETVESLKRDAEALKEFYKNRIKTLENRVARKTARLEQGAKEFHDLQHKMQTLDTELSNEQQKCRDVEVKLELERKSHMEMDETSKKNFEARFQEAQTAIEYRDKQIQQIDDICKSLQAHLVGARQSYAAAMGTARDLHRAHEKLSAKNRELVKQHRHAMDRIIKEHNSVCDSFADKGDAFVVEIVILKETILSMIDCCSCDGIQQRTAANIMQKRILDPHASKVAFISDKKDTDSQLPGETLKKEVGNCASEALNAMEGEQTKVSKRRLDKGKGIADDIAENRSREAAKTFAAPSGSEFSELQHAFRKGMAEAEMHQGVMAKPTPKAVHLDQQPSQPPKPKLTINTACLDKPQSQKPKPTPNTAHSNEPQQPPKPKLALEAVPSDGQPPKPSTSSPAPAPVKERSENRSKENPAASVPGQPPRSFSIRCDTFCGPKTQSAPANITDKVPASRPGVERSHPIPIPIAKEQNPAAQDNQA